MTKKIWEMPLAVIEGFAPNEYIAACGDSGTVYSFICNAGDSNVKYAIKDSSGNVATISGMYMNGGRETGFGRKGYYYHPCNTTHSAESDSGFLTGYHLDDPWTPEDENISVIIWTENGTDVHCTTNLNMNTWETTKS